MASKLQEAFKLPVTDLDAAEAFYLAALKPLDYRIIGRTERELRGGQSLPVTVELGPSDTSRVDLILSQSTYTAKEELGGKPHIFFPATSKLAVRDFYDAVARKYGTAVISPPSDDQRGYSTTVRDPDGNQIGAVFYGTSRQPSNSREGPVTAGQSEDGGSIQSWRETVADYCTPAGGRPTAAAADDSPVSPTTVPASFDAPRRAIPKQSNRPMPPARRWSSDRYKTSKPHRTSSNRSKTSEPHRASNVESGPGPRVAIGAAIAATVTAGVGYLLKKEVDDSRTKERDFDRKVQRRYELEQEARAATRSSDRAARWSAPRRRSTADRDSGYYSTTSVRSYKPRPRSTTFPKYESKPSRKSVSRQLAPQPTELPLRSKASNRDAQSKDPRSHISVSQAPSRPSKPPPLPRARYIVDDRNDRGSHPAPKKSTSDASRTTARRASYQSQRRGSDLYSRSSNRTARREPPVAPRASKGSTTTSYRIARDTQLPRSPHPSLIDESMDDLETVVPDDSISRVG